MSFDQTNKRAVGLAGRVLQRRGAGRTRALAPTPFSAALVCAVLGVVAVPLSRLDADLRPAEVSLVEGTAQRTPAKGAAHALKTGSNVGVGDTLTTEAESRLELKFADQSVLRIGPSASLLLKGAHFGEGPSKRKMTAKLFFGNVWAKVTSIISGDQKFAVETENAVAGVRGTTFRVDARSDKSVLVRVYAGAVAVARNVTLHPGGKPGAEREEVAGPEEVSREQWEKLVGKQMQIVIGPDGTPGEPTRFAAEDEKDDSWARWNEARDSRGDKGEKPAKSDKPE
jgi:hypothetical protein